MPRRVAVVPHTHWDREWYESFQSFRLKLVDLVDGLLDLLEADPAFTHFQLDGQMAAVDDYLAVRPDAEDRLRALAAAGRLSMGPWYALPDEFLVSGETLVRNLTMGLERAAHFGGAMAVGYLPDMFGHVAQMPQLFRLLGLEHAVVWRGVPAAVDRDAFWWDAPDGSRVRAEYLLDGYSNGAHLPDEGAELVRRVQAWEDTHGPALTGDVLWMNGTDHLFPRADLPGVLAQAHAHRDDYRFDITSLADYLAAQPVDDLPTWQGELRSGARANLLMGVTSNRTDVRQAAAGAERSLERLAEPLSALHLPADRWPAALLAQAWRHLVLNSAHDSVCACSADTVCDAVLVRYAEATDIATGLADRAVAALGDTLAVAGPVAVNPSPRPRSGLVELRLPGGPAGAELGEAAQVLYEHPTDIPVVLTRELVATLATQLLTYEAAVTSAEVHTGDDGSLELEVRQEPGARAGVAAKPVITALWAAGDGDPATPSTLRLRFPPARQVLVRVPSVPAYGWKAWEPGPLDVDPVHAGDGVLDNGLVRVEVNPTDATFSLTDLTATKGTEGSDESGPGGRAVRGLGRLVDGGDTGDTYNYNPPDSDRLVDHPETVEVATVETGPLRARLAVDARYTWPAQMGWGGRSDDHHDVVVHTTLELQAGWRHVLVTVELDNTCRDHRLRAHFPLPTPAQTSRAECAFDVVTRGLHAEGGPTERALPTFPSRRFVTAGGLTVAHDGLPEYELVDVHEGAARELALTLLRATGMLSQPPMAYRPLPAGPFHRLAGSQVPGPHRLAYAVAFDDTDPWTLVDEAFLPLTVTRARGRGDRPGVGSALEVRGAPVSAVLREAGALTVRVFNPTDDTVTVEIPGRSGWLVDLRGHARGPFDASFALAPHAIATARLDP